MSIALAAKWSATACATMRRLSRPHHRYRQRQSQSTSSARTVKRENNAKEEGALTIPAENSHDSKRLAELQALPLDRKIQITQARIIEWYQHFNGNVYVSFSGGKDSTVLLHLARRIYPDIPAVFINTGLEYPQIQAFVHKQKNVEILYPKMSFSEVLSTYGYPLINKETAQAIYYARRHTGIASASAKSTKKMRDVLCGQRTYDYSTPTCRRRMLLGSAPPSNGRKKSRYNKEKYLPLAEETPFLISHNCCSVMKKSPGGIYQRRTKRYPILATMAEESLLRRQAWIRHGCNAFDGKKKTSQPISFWTEQDVLAYIARYNLAIASIYGEIVCDAEKENCPYKTTGCSRTGCIFCAFGFHREKGETRFQSLAKTNPRQYEYCIGGGQWVDNPLYDPVLSREPDEMGWIEWNPKQLWVPSKQGLGMGKVFDMCNAIYGKDFMRYE